MHTDCDVALAGYHWPPRSASGRGFPQGGDRCSGGALGQAWLSKATGLQTEWLLHHVQLEGGSLIMVDGLASDVRPAASCSGRDARVIEDTFAALLGNRSDLVVDLRDGERVRSYLRAVAMDADQNLKEGHCRCRRSSRALDLCLGGIAAAGAVPILVWLSAISSFAQGRQVFYAQERVGCGGRVFRCWKLRTMHVDAEKRLADILRYDPELGREYLVSHKLSDDLRVTRLGGFLRSASLDELPQLLNVLRGELSLVGPRPLMPFESIRYGDDIAEVTSVRPGITRVWQVSGRSDLTFDERVELDLRSVRAKSIWTDLGILARTVLCVLHRKGSS